MKKLLLSLFVILTILFCSVAVSAQTVVKDQGFASRGGRTASMAGVQSTNKLLETYPSCTVTVYITGTTTLATLYSDSSLTPKSNPFTASSEGFYEYYAAPGVYDIRFSGTGITGTFTRSGIRLRGGDSTQTVYLADFGAVPDAKESTASINSSDPLHTVYNLASANFTSGMVGNVIYVDGAGVGGGMLKSTITSYLSSTAVAIADAASTSVAGAAVYWGTDNTTAINNAIAYGASLSGAVVQAAAGAYMITQIPFTTSTREITFRGVADGANRFGARGTQFWSALGYPYSTAYEGIFKATAPVNSSTPMNLSFESFGIRALDTKQFQAGLASVGGTYITTRHIYVLNAHWGIVHDQDELSDDSYDTLESYSEPRGTSVITGYDPTRQGWTKTGSGTVGVEPGVDQYKNEWGGRWGINTTVSADQTNYTITLPSNIFDKGAVVETKPAETVSGGTGSSAITRIQSGTYRYDIQWQSGGAGSFKVNGGTTISSPSVTLSSIVTLQIFPGGATAQVRVDGNIVIASVAGTAISSTAQAGFGDFDGTNNSNAYYQWVRIYGSYPRAAALWYLNGDDWWQSRQSNTYPYGYMRAGYSAVACLNNACNFSQVDTTKSVSVAGAGTAGATLTATVSSYVGDGYIWLTSDATNTDTTINVTDTSLFPSSGWFYWGGEASFYTGKTSTTLTGVVRGLMGTTAVAHTAVDSHTVSINLFRQFFLSSNAATTVTAANVTYNQASAPEFTNRMSFDHMQFNTTSVEVAHDGGYAFSGHESNFNQGSNQVRLGYVVGGSLWSNEHEGMSSDTIIAPQSFLQGRCCGSPFNFAIRDSLINRPAASNAWGMWLRGGSPRAITNNDLVAATGAFILADDTGAVGKITLHANRTSGAKEISNPFGQYPWVVSDSNSYEFSTPFTGGPAVESLTSLAYRLRTRNIELHYDTNPRERGKSGQGSVSATSTAFTASVAQFDASYTGKTIELEGAGVGGATLTTTVTYVDSTHLTLGTAASTTVSLANYKIGYSGADAKSSNIRFFDDSDTYYSRMYAPTAFTANRLVKLIDQSGYSVLSSILLTAGRVPYSTTGGILTDISTFQFNGTQLLIPDGAQATPGLAFTAEAGTGVYRLGNGRMAFSGQGSYFVELNRNGGAAYMQIYGASAPTLATSSQLRLSDYANGTFLLSMMANTTSTYGAIQAHSSVPGYDYVLALQPSGGSVAIGGTTVDNSSTFEVYSKATGSVATTIKLFSGQTADGWNLLKSDGTVLAKFDKDGKLTAAAVTDSALTSGRIPFVSTGGLLIDSSQLTFDLASDAVLAMSGTNAKIRASSNAGVVLEMYAGAAGIIRTTTATDLTFQANNTTAATFANDTSRTTHIGSGVVASETAQLFVRPRTASLIGLAVRLAPTPSADAWQLQDSGSTVLTRFSKEGWLGIGAAPTSTRNLYLYLSQATDTTIRVENPSTTTGARALLQAVADTASFQIAAGTSTDGNVITFRGAGGGPMYIWQASNNDLIFYTNNAEKARLTAAGMMLYTSVAFASLGTPANGSFVYCADCTIANPCAGGGTGAFAKRLNGVWVCN